jgi:hypothetical protein
MSDAASAPAAAGMDDKSEPREPTPVHAIFFVDPFGSFGSGSRRHIRGAFFQPFVCMGEVD